MSEAMGGARTCNLSSEKMAQAVALVNASTAKTYQKSPRLQQGCCTNVC